jgi:hypothetical protein
MEAFAHTVLIRRAPEAVFDFVTQPGNNVAWQPGLVAVEPVTPGPVGVGWRFRERRRILGRVLETEFEVQHHDAPRFSQIRAVNGLATIRASYRLRGDCGHTVLTAAGQVSGCPVGELAGTILARTARRELRCSMHRLKRVLEGLPAPTPPPLVVGDARGRPIAVMLET